MRLIKVVSLTALMLSSISSFGCMGDKAAEFYDTARFEEKQNNREHALQLYEEIIRKFPESDYAKRAKERIEEMKGDGMAKQ